MFHKIFNSMKFKIKSQWFVKVKKIFIVALDTLRLAQLFLHKIVRLAHIRRDISRELQREPTCLPRAYPTFHFLASGFYWCLHNAHSRMLLEIDINFYVIRLFDFVYKALKTAHGWLDKILACLLTRKSTPKLMIKGVELAQWMIFFPWKIAQFRVYWCWS